LEESKPRPQVTVLVPAFNEAENIPVLIPELCAMFDRHGLAGEIVLVDDGSTDGTWEIAEKFARSEKRLMKEKRPHGKPRNGIIEQCPEEREIRKMPLPMAVFEIPRRENTQKSVRGSSHQRPRPRRSGQYVKREN